MLLTVSVAFVALDPIYKLGDELEPRFDTYLYCKSAGSLKPSCSLEWQLWGSLPRDKSENGAVCALHLSAFVHKSAQSRLHQPAGARR